MKLLKVIIISVIGMIIFNSCQVDTDLNVNPNRPSQPDTRFLFLMAETYSTVFAWNNNYDPWVQIYPQYIAELNNIQFTKFSITDYSMSTIYSIPINNLQGVINLNKDENTQKEGWVVALGSNNNQIAAATTLKSFYFMHLTDIVGAIPYSESLKGSENFTPKFDSQEDVYKGLFKDLNEAYQLFERGALDRQYDILYNGDISKWKKLNASIRMMLAIKLQKADPALGKAEFSKAYKDGGIVDAKDNLRYKYLLENANQNPIYYNMVVDGRQDFSPSATLVEVLKEYDDPRLMEYTVPNKDGEYIGATFGWTAAEAAKSSLEQVCAFHPKYYKQDAPITLVSASQVLLMQAEAALAGWISADAETLYKEGIAQAFAQHGISSDKLDPYVAGPKVSFSGTLEEKLYKLAMQKWIANYLQDGVEAWSDWRRLNVPKLSPGNVGAISVDHIPYRKRYASVDIVSNKDNYNAAVGKQGPDNIETKLWWNKD